MEINLQEREIGNNGRQTDVTPTVIGRISYKTTKESYDSMSVIPVLRLQEDY